MAYITLKELEKILPGILSDWIDGDDESWEWIFQEIEQHCHVGKRKHIKGKKWKKKLRDDVDELQYFRHNEYEIKVNGIATRVNELNNKVSKLNDICNAHTVRLDNIGRDITAAKSMAEIAKERTEVDYSKYSGKSDGEKMCKTCKYSSNIDGSPKSFDAPPCDTCNHNNNWEAKDE